MNFDIELYNNYGLVFIDEFSLKLSKILTYTKNLSAAVTGEINGLSGLRLQLYPIYKLITVNSPSELTIGLIFLQVKICVVICADEETLTVGVKE